MIWISKLQLLEKQYVTFLKDVYTIRLKVKFLNLVIIGITSMIITGAILPAAFSESIQSTVNQNKTETLPYNGTQFDLKIGETFPQESDMFKIKLLNVTSDSRCPVTAYCIWQGQVMVLVEITQGTQYLGSFNLSTLTGHDNLVFGKYVLHLVDVKPPVLIGKQILASDYVITFVMSNTDIGSPLKQLKSGIATKDVKCNVGFQLVIKAENGFPACVRPLTATKLAILGWTNG